MKFYPHTRNILYLPLTREVLLDVLLDEVVVRFHRVLRSTTRQSDHDRFVGLRPQNEVSLSYDTIITRHSCSVGRRPVLDGVVCCRNSWILKIFGMYQAQVAQVQVPTSLRARAALSTWASWACWRAGTEQSG